MEQVTREYLKEQYEISVSDFVVASSEEKKENARKRLASIEELAITNHGFSFLDELHELRDEIKK